MGDGVFSHPPHLGAHQSISALAQPQGSLMLSAPTHSVLARSVPLPLLCQLYLQLTCPPPSLGLHPSRILGLSASPFLGPLASPSVGPTCCPSLHSGALPSSGMAQPVSGVPGGKAITDPASFQRLPSIGRIWAQSIIMLFVGSVSCASYFISALYAVTHSTFRTTLHEGTVIVIPNLQRRN